MSKNGSPVTRIVVGVDGSEGSAAALRWAISEAQATGAEVVAVHAYEQPAYVTFPIDQSMPLRFEDGTRDAVQEAFEKRWTASLDTSGVPHRRAFGTGRAADVLLAVAEREGADLIVSGRRGLGTLGEMVLGSVSHYLTHHSACPVVLVPPPPPEWPGQPQNS